MPPTHCPDERSESDLTLTTLGATAVGTARTSTPAFTSGKPLALLTYLACAPGRSAPRDQLLDLLWADLERDPARHALRQTLWYARKKLGVDPFAVRGETIGLAGCVELDRDVFLAALDAGEPQRAVDTYAGDFFPGFAAPGGAEFERWADVERERLRALYIRAAHALARRRSGEHRHRDAVALARRVRDVAPGDEGGWRLVVECLIAAGDHIAASAEADQLERLASAEPLELEPATLAILRAARQRPASADVERGRALIAELVGREREFAAALAAWEAVRGGSHRHVHIVAPAGLGKSRLLGDFAARLRSTRGRVVHVQATPGSREMPYALAADLVGALTTLRGATAVSPAAAASLVALNPTTSARYETVPDPATGTEALRRRVLAVAELLTAVSHEAPVALLVDDVHWADPLSRQLLAAIAARILPNVLLVSAGRPPAATTFDVETAFVVPLAPLTPAQTTALLMSLGALPAEPWAEQLPERLHAASGGSPLVTLETLRLALDRGALALDDHRWCCPAPVGLDALLAAGGPTRRRIQQLGDEERRALVVLALAGAPLPEAVAAGALAALGADRTTLVQLERRGLAVQAEAHWSAVHDEIAVTAAELTPAGDACAAHSALGDAWAADPVATTIALHRAVRHFLAAGTDDRLARTFVRLAERARDAGDRRHPRQFAADVLGEHATRERTARLARAVPLRHRVDRVPLPAALAGAAAAALVVLGLVRYLGPPPPLSATLGLVYERENGTFALCTASFDDEPWQLGDTLEVACERSESLGDSTLIARPGVAPRPGGGWTVARPSGDSGGDDMFHVEPDGRSRRLTRTNGDDVGMVWSPLGDRVAFSTGRWDENSRYDIAVLEDRTENVTRLSSGPTRETSPVWSPDGREVAFVSVPEDSRPPELCAVSHFGGTTRCRPLAGLPLAGLLAWLPNGEIIGTVASGSQAFLVHVPLDSGEVTVMDPTPGTRTISADGRWVACRCQTADSDEPMWTVAPLGQPHRARPLRVRDVPGPSLKAVLWVARPGSDAPSRPASVLTLVPGPGLPVVGSPYALRVAAHTPEGLRARVGRLRWRSLDRAVATVTDSGTLQPLDSGTARIAVSAATNSASERETVFDIPMRPATLDRTLLSEDWARGLRDVWVPFGVPRPFTIVRPREHPAFSIEGDGGHTSGAYSTRTFVTRNGLVLDADVSTRVTGEQWQTLLVELTARLHERKLLAWNRRVGDPPWREAAGVCGFAYAAGRHGPMYADSIALSAGPADVRIVAAPPALRTGEWTRLRMALSPDGRCAFSLGGRRLWTSLPVVTDSIVRVMIHGQSVGTRLLVGAVTLREGLDTPR